MSLNSFNKGVITLIISGFLSKLLGLIIKVTTTRLIGEEGIAMYMMILPTLMLVITLSQLGIPLALSKIIAEKNSNKKQIILSTIPIILTLNAILMIIMIMLTPYLANNFLKNPSILLPLYLITLTIPFFSISNVIKSYFIGTQNMFPTMIGHLFEQISRFIFIIVFIPKALEVNLSFAIQALIVGVMLGETVAICTLLFFIRKKINVRKSDFKIRKSNLKAIFSISIPTTGSRLIGSFSYFLEPIFITFSLAAIGYSRQSITFEYGIINGYALSLLLLPSFFSYAISTALIPALSKAKSTNNKSRVRSILYKSVFYSFITGGACTIFIMLFPKQILNTLYNTSKGVEYIKYLGPVFIIYYIQAPLTACLQASNKATLAMKSTLYAAIAKLSIILILPFFLDIGMYTLALANVVNILIVTTLHLYKVKKYVLL